MADLGFEWRGALNDPELNALHAEAFAHPILEIRWTEQLKAHSLGWVTARDGGELVGFVNVVWDGETHAFLLDTIVSARLQRQGIGTRLVEIAIVEARAAGCEWLHVDFDEEYRSFYLDACGFAAAPAGLMAL